MLAEPGYLPMTELSFIKKKETTVKEKDASEQTGNTEEQGDDKTESDAEEKVLDAEFLSVLEQMKKGESLNLNNLTAKEGKTSPPKWVIGWI